MKGIKVDNLNIKIFHTRSDLGKAAALDIAEKIKSLLSQKNEVRIVFAAAPSQDDMTSELIKIEGIEWDRIIVFHMDEYIGLPKDAPQRFGNYLKSRLFEMLPFKEVHYLDDGSENADIMCTNYEKKLLTSPIDIICMGIGENGHIAFNDPPVADFNDKSWVKIVELDNVCRQQQVNDGCFSSLDEVPLKAITLTIPVFNAAENLFCIVPNERKAKAVKSTLESPISTDCPSTIIRNHKSVVMYLDKDSSKLLVDAI